MCWEDDMHIREARIFFASLTLVVFCGTSIFAAEPNSPPRVDASGVNLQPPYPETAMQNLERGAAVLGVVVTAQGRVTRVSLIETSGFNDLDASAISTVLGWKFMPAIKDGTPVEGTTMVKLVFEPPAASPNTASAQPPPSSKLLFPVQMTMNAPEGEQEVQSFSVPCRRGAFEGVITIENDATKGGKMTAFVVQLSAGSDSGQFAIDHIGARLVGANIRYLTKDKEVTGVHYWGSGEMGVPIPISVGWGSGQVIGNGGIVFGQHQIGFGKDPEKLAIAAYFGDV